jgi:hypothetical protein
VKYVWEYMNVSMRVCKCEINMSVKCRVWCDVKLCRVCSRVIMKCKSNV